MSCPMSLESPESLDEDTIEGWDLMFLPCWCFYK
jgi:hypothetical protein